MTKRLETSNCLQHWEELNIYTHIIHIREQRRRWVSVKLPTQTSCSHKQSTQWLVKARGRHNCIHVVGIFSQNYTHTGSWLQTCTFSALYNILLTCFVYFLHEKKYIWFHWYSRHDRLKFSFMNRRRKEKKLGSRQKGNYMRREEREKRGGGGEESQRQGEYCKQER